MHSLLSMSRVGTHGWDSGLVRFFTPPYCSLVLIVFGLPKCLLYLSFHYKYDVSFVSVCVWIGQLVVCTLCSCVMQTKRIWLFSAHLLPLVARLCLVPLETIVFVNRFAMIFTGLEVIYFLASNLLVPFNLAKTAYRELAQVRNCLAVVMCTRDVHKHCLLRLIIRIFYLGIAIEIILHFTLLDIKCLLCNLLQYLSNLFVLVLFHYIYR